MKKAKPLVVINVVGLTHNMLGPATPNISALATEGFSRPLQTVFPAVTCTVQSSLLTGLLPREHGIVGNGWYYGSDGIRSPLHYMRNPGEPEYDGSDPFLV